MCKHAAMQNRKTMQHRHFQQCRSCVCYMVRAVSRLLIVCARSFFSKPCVLQFLFGNSLQGVYLSGIPENVREFDSCKGNVRDFTKNQRNVREKILSGKSCLKLIIANCIFVSIQVFSTSTGMIWVTLNMSRSAANSQGISHCLESGHPVINLLVLYFF